METSWPEAVLCLGLTAMVCATFVTVAWLASKNRQ